MAQNKYSPMKKIIPYLLILLILGHFSTSCGTAAKARKEQKKDNAAVGRIISNPKLRDSIFRIGFELHPCANDSSIVYIKGDSLVFSDSVLIHDTDKVTKVVTDKWYITKRVQTTVTKKITVKDVQLENLLRGDKDLAIKQAIDYLNRTIKAEEEADDYRRQKNLYLWLLIGIGVIALGFGIYKLWPKPTKKATDLLKGINKN
jgi:hypothetical protein